MSIRGLLRKSIPLPVRVEWVRLRAWPRMRRERKGSALTKGASTDYPYRLDSHQTPLCRPGTATDPKLQQGKETNIRIAVRQIDGIVIDPGETFSYHQAVGRPSRIRGFRKGLELHGGELEQGIGGGCCAVSNLLYLIAIRSGLQIVERHRHELDLFPDHGRTVPFGCGATVFYPTKDLRIRNPLDVPIQLRLTIEDNLLKGCVASSEALPYRIEVVEFDHRFEKDGDGWTRSNRIVRRYLDADGELLREEELARNFGRCLYDPENQHP